MRRSWITTEVRTMLEQYGTQNLASISAELNRSRFSVAQKARRLFLCNGQPRQRAALEKSVNSNSVNARYFENINSGVAFTLGFIFSCGTLKTQHRRVLKLSVERHRRFILQTVLAELQSKHVIQEPTGHLIVEVCNDYLVRSLVAKWGQLPSRANPDPAMRELPDPWMRDFVCGHVAGAGLINSRIARWTGSRSIVESITDFLTKRLSISNPTLVNSGSKRHVSWNKGSDLEQIRDFLEI